MSIDLNAVRERVAEIYDCYGIAEPLELDDFKRGEAITEFIANAQADIPALLGALEAATADAERMRLAWTSARGRAAGYLDELDETRAELAALSRAYLEVCQSLQVYRGDLP